jgi:hypothetical protein
MYMPKFGQNHFQKVTILKSKMVWLSQPSELIPSIFFLLYSLTLKTWRWALMLEWRLHVLMSREVIKAICRRQPFWNPSWLPKSTELMSPKLFWLDSRTLKLWCRHQNQNYIRLMNMNQDISKTILDGGHFENDLKMTFKVKR